MKTSGIISKFMLLISLPILAAGQMQSDCARSGCHDKMGTQEFMHGPVGAGICNVCHVPVEGEDHKFQFFAEKDELCFSCHEESRDMMLNDFLHSPVSEGNCIGCHDPHQSDFRFTLKGNAADLCFQCHNNADFTMSEVHGPVAVGDCNACHNPHASSTAKLLLDQLPQLCVSCHKEKEEEMNRRHVHAPVEEDCLKCHDPHSSVDKFLLPEKSPELCYTCHHDIQEIAGKEYKHQPMIGGECNACHEPHASDNPKLFTAAPENLCFKCHQDVNELVLNSSHKHGPINEGDCNACHSPHGSDNPNILKKYFPSEFYIPYAEENYNLCFECHNRNVATDEKTDKLTDFRNDDINMHFLHVNKQEKGRSCRACHQVHASTQEKHIRESVPYGKINWELPVNYTKYDDGGKCVVGCHGPKEYRRK